MFSTIEYLFIDTTKRMPHCSHIGGVKCTKDASNSFGNLHTLSKKQNEQLGLVVRQKGRRLFLQRCLSMLLCDLAMCMIFVLLYSFSDLIDFSFIWSHSRIVIMDHTDRVFCLPFRDTFCLCDCLRDNYMCSCLSFPLLSTP